jgi:hypothetical protein
MVESYGQLLTTGHANRRIHGLAWSFTEEVQSGSRLFNVQRSRFKSAAAENKKVKRKKVFLIQPSHGNIRELNSFERTALNPHNKNPKGQATKITKTTKPTKTTKTTLPD